MYHFSVDYNSTDVDDILDIHKYLMKKHDTKQFLNIFKKMFIGLLSFLGSLVSGHIGKVYLSNRPYQA